MKFNINSPIVKDYVLLIRAGEKTIEQVPDIGNLREVVSDVLGQP